MAGLQRSAVSFRRQGSSGLVWDDKILLGELNTDKKPDNLEQDNPENKTQDKIKEKDVNNKDSAVAAVQPSSDGGGGGGVFERSRSSGGGGGRGYRTGKVSPAIEPPSPRISACGFCGAFGKENKNRRNRFSNAKRSGRSR